MRIFFSGSGRHASGRGDEIPDELRIASRDLGHAMALRGHALMVSTERPGNIDPYIVQGAQRLGALAVRPLVEVHRLAGRSTAFAVTTGVRLLRVTYDHPIPPEDKSLEARGGAVGGADAVVVLGGSDSTRGVIRCAERLGKPVVPVASFGGAGEEALREREARWRSWPGLAPLLAPIAGPWRGEDSAAAVLALVDLLAGRHVYHLSAAAGDAAAGDHLEALLRRHARAVQRIEHPVGLSDAAFLIDQVAGADTFVALWSRHAAADPRCFLERDAALGAAEAAAGRLRRSVCIVADDTPAPAGPLLPGATRSERESAVWRLVAGEHAP